MSRVYSAIGAIGRKLKVGPRTNRNDQWREQNRADRLRWSIAKVMIEDLNNGNSRVASVHAARVVRFNIAD